MHESLVNQTKKNLEISQIITGKQLAKYLNISYYTVRKWTSEKKLPYLKLGRSVRFDLEDINKFLKNNTVEVQI